MVDSTNGLKIPPKKISDQKTPANIPKELNLYSVNFGAYFTHIELN
jgi:hypothetical protein